MRCALHHPGLARLIVFLDEIPISPLLEPLYDGTTVVAQMRALSAQISLRQVSGLSAGSAVRARE